MEKHGHTMTRALLPRPWFTGDATALAQAIVAGGCSATAGAGAHADRRGGDQPAAQRRVPAGEPDVGAQQAAALDAELAQCRSDAERRALLQRRPFFGVPLLLKDVGPATAHRGLPSRHGSRLFPEGDPWPVDGTLTQRYLAAGCVPFGRSTSPEMGMSASTEALAYGGPTRNPWNRAHSSGGSSGGAAAATASGMVTIAHANDGAGSIRIPASACGLIGLKASRGLMPHRPAGRRRLGRADHRPRGVAQRARLRACARRHRRRRPRRTLRRADAARQLRSGAGRRRRAPCASAS
jgi:amidase